MTDFLDELEIDETTASEQITGGITDDLRYNYTITVSFVEQPSGLRKPEKLARLQYLIDINPSVDAVIPVHMEVQCPEEYLDYYRKMMDYPVEAMTINENDSTQIYFRVRFDVAFRMFRPNDVLTLFRHLCSYNYTEHIYFHHTIRVEQIPDDEIIVIGTDENGEEVYKEKEIISCTISDDARLFAAKTDEKLSYEDTGKIEKKLSKLIEILDTRENSPEKKEIEENKDRYKEPYYKTAKDMLFMERMRPYVISKHRDGYTENFAMFDRERNRAYYPCTIQASDMKELALRMVMIHSIHESFDMGSKYWIDFDNYHPRDVQKLVLLRTTVDVSGRQFTRVMLMKPIFDEIKPLLVERRMFEAAQLMVDRVNALDVSEILENVDPRLCSTNDYYDELRYLKDAFVRIMSDGSILEWRSGSIDPPGLSDTKC